jgi:hypothetical protein
MRISRETGHTQRELPVCVLNGDVRATARPSDRASALPTEFLRRKVPFRPHPIVMMCFERSAWQARQEPHSVSITRF